MSDPVQPPAPAPAAAPPSAGEPAAPAAAPATTAVPTARRVLARPTAPAAAPATPPAPAAAAPAPAPAQAAAAAPPPAPASDTRVIERAPAASPPAAAPATDPRLAALEGALGALTQSIVGTALPEPARAAFAQAYADDPLGAAKALAFIQASGLAQPAPLPVGATTAPPAPPAPGAPVDADAAAHATYESLRAKAPQAAAHFLLANRDAIERGRAKAAPQN